MDCEVWQDLERIQRLKLSRVLQISNRLLLFETLRREVVLIHQPLRSIELVTITRIQTLLQLLSRFLS